MSAYLLRFSQSRMSGYSSAIHGGTYQPMMPSLPVSPASCTRALVVDVLRDQVVVAPVLDDGVDRAVGHALPADLLLHLRVVDVAAQLLLRHDADDVRVGDVAGPWVDRDAQIAAVAGRPRLAVLDVAAAAGESGEAEAHDRSEGDVAGYGVVLVPCFFLSSLRVGRGGSLCSVGRSSCRTARRRTARSGRA